MRKLVICMCGAAAALVAIDHVAAGSGLALLDSGWFAKAPGASVNRTLKGDRAAAPVAGGGELRIAAVEIVGLEAAAIVYRDREGRVLFRTDPVGNTTVVVRDVTLPAVTVRQTRKAPVQPVILQPERQENPAQPAPKLPDGCEPAASLLSASGKSGLGARCFAAHDLGAVKLALR